MKDIAGYGFCESRNRTRNDTSESNPQLTQIHRNLDDTNCTCNGVGLDHKLKFGEFLVKIKDTSGSEEMCICKAYKLDAGQKFSPLRPNNTNVPFMFV